MWLYSAVLANAETSLWVIKDEDSREGRVKTVSLFSLSLDQQNMLSSLRSELKVPSYLCIIGVCTEARASHRQELIRGSDKAKASKARGKPNNLSTAQARSMSKIREYGRSR